MKIRNPFYRLSIRTKIVLMIMGMSVIFGTGILAFIYVQIQSTLRDEAISKTRILADGLSAKAAEPVQVEDLNALQLSRARPSSSPTSRTA